MADEQRITYYTPPREQILPDNVPTPVQIRRRKLTWGEKLLRNSAIACALLFALLSLKNIDHPMAQTTAAAVEKALTIDFDVDETLGELQFVRRFLPESTLVFWNMNGETALQRPTEGAILHEYTDLQPWYLFTAVHGAQILCAKTGTLTGAVQTDKGDWALEVSHSDGTRTIYAYVDRGTIEIGEEIHAGEVISAAALQGCLYFEYQKDGKSIAVEAFAS